jgi:hypothetical protein
LAAVKTFAPNTAGTVCESESMGIPLCG